MPQSKIRRYLKHGTMTQLSVFEAVARLGNFTRAAEELHISQPTASVQIKKLAETIGLPLFEQVGNRVHATEAGRALQRACEGLFGELAKVEDSFSSMRALESGRLWIAASTTGKFFVPRLLADFVKQHPGIEASLQFHNRAALLERLAEDADDLCVLADPPRDRDLVVQRILPDPMMVFARADHALARQARIAFESLAREPFLMREHGSGARALTESVFARHGLQPQVSMVLSTNEAIKEAIVAGLGVSIMSHHTLDPQVDRNRLVTLDVAGFPLERHWYFAYPVGKQLSLAAQAFMEFAHEHAPRNFASERRATRYVAQAAAA